MYDKFQYFLNSLKTDKNSSIIEAITQGFKVCFEEIKAYHGTPHAFEVFGPLENVSGTGQGANSFGYGIYFTDEPEIAQFYANQLQTVDIHDISIKGLPIYKNDTPVDYSATKSGEHVASLQEELLINEHMFKEDIPKTELLTKVRAFFDNEIESAKSEIPNEPEYYKTRIGILEKYKPNKVDDIYINKSHNKNVYSVILNKGKSPEQYDYLKWDEPITVQQSKKINSELRKEKKKFIIGFGNDEDETGKFIYKELTDRLGSDKAASEFLLRAGIDGIDYPAGSLSGISNSKARNYVVFDPKSVTIERKL